MTFPERKSSILSRVITAAAQRLAQDPAIPVENRQAFAATAASVMHAQWSAMFGGETVKVRVYAPHQSATARADRRARILEHLRRGHRPADIAAAEGVSERWVRKLRAELMGMESSAPVREDGRETAPAQPPAK